MHKPFTEYEAEAETAHWRITDEIQIFSHSFRSDTGNEDDVRKAVAGCRDLSNVYVLNAGIVLNALFSLISGRLLNQTSGIPKYH